MTDRYALGLGVELLGWRAEHLPQVIEDLEILAPLLLDADLSRTVRLAVDAADGRFSIVSRERSDDEPWRLHATGRLVEDCLATRVAPDTIHPTWAGVVPHEAIQFEAGEGDISAQAVGLRGDTVAVFGPIRTGSRGTTLYEEIGLALLHHLVALVEHAPLERDEAAVGLGGLLLPGHARVEMFH